MEITLILEEVEKGVAGAADRLAAAVFSDLHRIAESAMDGRAKGIRYSPPSSLTKPSFALLGRASSHGRTVPIFSPQHPDHPPILVDHARHRSGRSAITVCA